MTIPTPTGHDPGAAGLPDVATLTQLAAQVFAALPGGGGNVLPSNPVPEDPLPGGLNPGPFAKGPVLPGALVPGGNLAPTSPQSGVAGVASAPALVPKAVAVNGLPDLAAIAPPAINGRFGGHSLGVPAPAAAPVSTPVAPAHPPVPAYYFLVGTPTAPASTVPPGPDLVSAQGFGLPGQGDLAHLLAEPARSAAPGADYYFAPATPRAAPASAPYHGLDVNAVRRDFPILQERVNGRPLVWFDNAATTQKPKAVIDRLTRFYEHENSNIHRAAHELAARATDAYEGARDKVRLFLGAASSEEIVFVRGATEGINLIANTWGEANIGAGDEIIVSHLEHHANIVPWQMLAARKGAKIRVIPVDDTGQVILDEYTRLLTPRTKLLSVTQVSNALGTVVPVHEIVALAKAAGVTTVVDGAQSVSHLRVNVQAIGTDFFVFSGHKVFGPTGIGVVYGRKAVLDAIPPWQGGGNMIADVTFEKTLYQPPPNKFEAGTGNIADAVGLGAALDYVQKLGLEAIAAYEHDLLAYATQHLAPIKGVRIIGTAAEKASVLSFVLDGQTTEQVGRALNDEGIAVRSGHHCAQPILRRFGLETTVRPSLAFYNTCEEVDRFIAVVRRLAKA
ncbi:family 2A encapsulin nanocompartment cargo protein cysteine desulfurase [Fuscovulum blasticum]|uniref:family 2A encapsulin nanocompartment cargo protein cysteine desulfurase n=1 Tax=Fuscovulum blasticum TaxID=1075 RepID=UPI000D3E49CE|nr:family 2A encapsulin nanocompartment cargo protein cysteine desulfurase [Fuscovulum blasticum]AWD22545.1 cysteine desulfurase [Fuscovulum blasticum]